MPQQDLLTLLRHHIGIANEITQALGRRDAAARGVDERPPAPPTPGPAATATPAPAVGGRPDPFDVVMRRADTRVRDVGMTILDAVANLEGVGEPIPERPRNEKPPKYLRLTRGTKSFAYVHVRRDHLRIDLAIPGHLAPELPAEGQASIRVREVREDNPWQVSFYARDANDAQPAIEAMRFAYNRVKEVSAA
jgi:hypothetical protein